LQAALAIEALTQAVRHAGFMVPAGLGVQEAAVLLFGHRCSRAEHQQSEQ